MPIMHRPVTALLVFTGMNFVLIQTVEPIYDFVCFLPFWERRTDYHAHLYVIGAIHELALSQLRERRRQEREAASTKGVESS